MNERKKVLILDMDSNVIKADDVIDSLTVMFFMIMSSEANTFVARNAIDALPDDILSRLISGLEFLTTQTNEIIEERKTRK